MVSRHFAAEHDTRLRTVRDDYELGINVGAGTYGAVYKARSKTAFAHGSCEL